LLRSLGGERLEEEKESEPERRKNERSSRNPFELEDGEERNPWKVKYKRESEI